MSLLVRWSCDTLYRVLGVRWSNMGTDFKAKPSGAERLADVEVQDEEFIRIGAEDAGHHIDASVLRGERQDFLMPNERKYGGSGNCGGSAC